MSSKRLIYFGLAASLAVILVSFIAMKLSIANHERENQTILHLAPMTFETLETRNDSGIRRIIVRVAGSPNEEPQVLWILPDTCIQKSNPYEGKCLPTFPARFSINSITSVKILFGWQITGIGVTEEATR